MNTSSVIDSIVSSNPILTQDEQLSLVKEWQQNENKVALDRLILSNMRLVNKEAFSIKKKNAFLSYDDLVQEGIAGLLKAASKFDFDKKVRFVTYAMIWIRANMRSYVLSYRSVVKMGTTKDDRILFSNLSKCMKKAEALDLEGEEKIEYMSSEMGVSKKSIYQMLISLKGFDKRLDAPIKSSDGADTLLVNLLEDEGSGEVRVMADAALEDKEVILSKIVSELPEIEGKIIRSRYLCEETKTLRELEPELSISREWARKLEIRALDRIRKRLKSEYGISNIAEI